MLGAEPNVAYHLFNQTASESRDFKLAGHHLAK